MPAHIAQKLLLVGVKSEIVLCARMVLGFRHFHHRKVKAFAAYPRNDDDRRVEVLVIGFFNRGGVLRIRGFSRIEVRRAARFYSGVAPPARAGKTLVFIEGAQNGVAFEARLLEPFVKRALCKSGVAAARTGAAIDEIYGVFAEHAHLALPFFERKGFPVIGEEYRALALYFAGDRKSSFVRFLLARCLLFVIDGLFAACVHLYGAHSAEGHVEHVAPIRGDTLQRYKQRDHDDGYDQPYAGHPASDYIFDDLHGISLTCS